MTDSSSPSPTSLSPNPPGPLSPGLLARCLALLVLLAVAAAAWLDLRPPPARGDDAPANAFSAERALRHLPSIASRPHPVGSAENARVRAYLLDQLQALGLQPQVQTAFVAKPDRWGVIAGTVHNIVARLPGREPGPALALIAHYDSVPTGPGAADNGASVAAVLETLRALRAGAPLRNEVMVVFTDAEEADLLGAEAFVAQHPWARRIALALNFDFRGNRGPSMLFETSPGNGRMVAQFVAAAPHPVGGSLGYELYRRMPNSTDFKVFKQAGIAGLNFAAIEGHTHYHTQIDRIDRLQPGSVQQMGENMLAAARSFGDGDLQALHDGEDRVFFNAPGLGMPHYGAGWALAFTALAVALSLVLFALALRGGAVRAGGVARALPLFALGLILAGGLCQAVWIAVGWLHPGYATLLQGDTYNSHWYLLAFLALAAGVHGVSLAATARWCSALEAGFAAMLVWTALLCWAAAAVPGAGYLLLWPLLAAQAGTGASLMRPGRGSANARLALQTAAAIPGVALFAVVLWALFVALTPSRALVAGVAAMLLFGLLTPLLAQIAGRGAGRQAPWLAAAAFLAAGSVTAGFDAAHPRQNSLMYAQDAVGGQAWWISRDERPDAWTGRYLGAAPARRTLPEFFGADSDLFWVAPTPAVPAPPRLRLDAERVDASLRTLALTIASSRDASRLMLSVEGATVVRARVGGVWYANSGANPGADEADADSAPEWMLDVYGHGDAPLPVELELKAGSAYSLRLVDASYQPPMMRVPRPEGMIAQPFSLNGAALVRTELHGGGDAKP